METSRKITFSVIVLIVFVVLIFGASYAYYSTTINESNSVSNFNVNMPQATPTCSITCNKTSITLSPAMSDFIEKPTSSLVASSDAIYCNATYSGESSAGTKCQFDVIWYWESADIYNRNLSENVTGWEYNLVGNFGGLTNVTHQYMPNTTGTILASNIYILGNGATAANTNQFIFTSTLYNSSDSQDGMIGKTYVGKIKIENVRILPV